MDSMKYDTPYEMKHTNSMKEERSESKPTKPLAADAIADEIGGTVVSIDPLAQNYIENLREMVSKIVEGLA